ncbi:MAG: shikimate kinase [Nitriliruptoraceae bacterium]
MMSRSICLTGMMGSGKSTVGRLVADRLGRRIADTDTELCRWTGVQVSDLFAQHGESGFRELERTVVVELARHDDLVIALGGGTLLDDVNVDALRTSGVVVLLDVPVEVLAERLAVEAETRPLLADATPDERQDRLRSLFEQRRQRYEAASVARFDAARPPGDVAEDIVQWAVSCGDVLTPSEHEQVTP